MSCNIRRRAVTGLIKTKFCIIQTCRRKHSDRACYHARLIRKNIAKHILCKDHIKLSRIVNKLHSAIVNQHMLQSYLRVVLCHFFHNLSPEPGRVQHIGLIYACHLFLSLHGNVKGLYCNTADFIFVIGKCINGCFYPIFLNCFSFPEIKTSGKLPDNNHIKAFSNDLFFQGAGCLQFLIKIRRTKISKKIQSLADCQKPCLRASGRFQFVPGRSLCIPSNGTHQNCIRSLCSFYCFFCQRNSVYVNRSAS